jgi:hypothetical protein
MAKALGPYIVEELQSSPIWLPSQQGGSRKLTSDRLSARDGRGSFDALRGRDGPSEALRKTTFLRFRCHDTADASQPRIHELRGAPG